MIASPWLGRPLAAALLATVLWPNSVSATTIGPLPMYTGACALAVAAAERAWALPRELLLAVAIAESGRGDRVRRAKIAWPWTVTAGGRGRYFATKAAAIAQVRSLQANGTRNIDVGCMQINLMYHPDAFASLEQAFDPQRNAQYAASYLRSLHTTTRSWSGAVAHYHSKHQPKGKAYWKRVSAIWRDARRRAFEAERKMRTAAHR